MIAEKEKTYDGEKYVMVNKEHLYQMTKKFTNLKQVALMNYFLAKMNRTNACCVSQKVLTKVLGCTRKTVRNVIDQLQEMRMINVYKIGAQNVYVVNSECAWSTNRGRKEFAIFDATIVLDYDEQSVQSRKLWDQPLQAVPKQLILDFDEEVKKVEA